MDEDDVLELIRTFSDISDGLIVFIGMQLHREEEAKSVQHIFYFLKKMKLFFTEARW